MGYLDKYKEAIKAEQESENMDFPTDTNLTEKDKEAYEAVLKKMRNGDFSMDEVNEAIQNSKQNMSDLGDVHIGGNNEANMKTVRMERLTDEELESRGLLIDEEISDIKVIRAYCPICGKQLVSKAPPMYNPFTMEKVCVHECCGQKFNLDKTYPHIAFYDEDGIEINAFL